MLVCDRCGTLLFDPRASTVHMRVDPTLLQLRRRREKQTGPLADNSHIVSLLIRGISERLAFEEGTEIVLGRIDFTNPDLSRLDLTRYGGHERGVSREHALLRYQDAKLTVTDLHSVNGTMVNLIRLEPNHPWMLKDGDELMLGTLLIKVRFEMPPAAVPTPKKQSEDGAQGTPG